MHNRLDAYTVLNCAPCVAFLVFLKTAASSSEGECNGIFLEDRLNFAELFRFTLFLLQKSYLMLAVNLERWSSVSLDRIQGCQLCIICL